MFLGSTSGQSDKSGELPADSLKAGIVRRVLSLGAPVIVPFEDITDDSEDGPRYFICVPMKARQKTLGAIYVERQYYDGIDLERDLQLINVLSGILTGMALMDVPVDGSAENDADLPAGAKGTFAEQVESFEKGIIIRALEKARGNQTRAARDLGTSLRIFNYKVGKYLIDYRQFRKTGK